MFFWGVSLFCSALSPGGVIEPLFLCSYLARYFISPSALLMPSHAFVGPCLKTFFVKPHLLSLVCFWLPSMIQDARVCIYFSSVCAGESLPTYLCLTFSTHYLHLLALGCTLRWTLSVVFPHVKEIPLSTLRWIYCILKGCPLHPPHQAPFCDRDWGPPFSTCFLPSRLKKRRALVSLSSGHYRRKSPAAGPRLEFWKFVSCRSRANLVSNPAAAPSLGSPCITG